MKLNKNVNNILFSLFFFSCKTFISFWFRAWVRAPGWFKKNCLDTFVNLILLLIDPYTLLFNGCNSSHYFWHINGKWGFRTKEAVVMWKQDPFILSGLQQWAVRNSDWMKVKWLNIYWESLLNIHQTHRIKKTVLKEIYTESPWQTLWSPFSNFLSQNTFTLLKIIKNLKQLMGYITL